MNVQIPPSLILLQFYVGFLQAQYQSVTSEDFLSSTVSPKETYNQTSTSLQLPTQPNPSNEESTEDISVCFKTRINTAKLKNKGWKERMPENSLDYPGLIYNGETFVDKTMLIKYVTFFQRVYLITAPRKWGKTTNLKMIRYFFEAPTNKDRTKLTPLKNADNYLLFYHQTLNTSDLPSENHILEKQLLISEDAKFMRRNLGRYPVIYLDFIGILTESCDLALNAIKGRIMNAFKEHIYVKVLMRARLASHEDRSTVEKDIEKFEAYQFGYYPNTDYTTSINFLCYCLMTYTDLKRPIILIDEHDIPFLHAYLNNRWKKADQNELINWFSSFFSHTFKSYSSYTFAIITGCIRIVEKHLFSSINNFRHYNFLNCEDIFFFYGFHQSEVDEIMEINKVPEKDRKIAQLFYNGYRGGKGFELTIYNPYSIARYISAQEVDSYWVDVGSVANLLKVFLNHPSFQKKFLELINGGIVSIERALDMSDDNLNSLAKVLSTGITEEDIKSVSVVNSVLKLMYSAGYFTRAFPNNAPCLSLLKQSTVHVKIPNEEVRMHLTCYLTDEHIEELLSQTNDGTGPSEQHYEIFKTNLKTFLITNTTVSSYVTRSSQNVLKRMPEFVVTKKDLKFYWLQDTLMLYGDEAVARILFDHTIIFHLMVKEHLIRIAGLERTFTFLGQQYQIDLALIHKDEENMFHGTLIEYKFMRKNSYRTEQETSEHALIQCLNYSSYFFVAGHKDVTTVKCIGISIHQDKNVTIDSYVMNSDNYVKYLTELEQIYHQYEKIKNNQNKVEVSNITLMCHQKYWSLLHATLATTGQSISGIPVHPVPQITDLPESCQPDSFLIEQT